MPTRACRGTRRDSWSGKMAHPLNRPQLDRAAAARRRGLRRPAAARDAVAADRARGLAVPARSSRAARHRSLRFAVSDVYQDLFGEGSYIGKGIYDVDAFEAALAGRVPDNALLSHDLFEGIFARAGLRRDIEVVEEFPRALRRRGRPAASLGARRLAAPAVDPRRAGATAAAGALASSGAGRCSTICGARCPRRPRSPRCSPAGCCRSMRRSSGRGFIVATIALPICLPVLIGLVPRRPGISKRSHAAERTRRRSRLAAARRSLLTRHAARASGLADASTRSCARCAGCAISRRRLLEWVTAAQAQSRGAGDGVGCLSPHGGWRGSRSPRSRCVVALTADPARWPCRAAVRRRSGLAPAVASRSGPAAAAAARAVRARAEDAAILCGSSRAAPGASSRRFVDAPTTTCCRPTTSRRRRSRCVAHRTSPTNIGLYLLSIVSARDFGWIGTLDMLGAARGDARARWSGSSASADTSTTGTTRTTCARSIRTTSRRWTAAISPAT